MARSRAGRHPCCARDQGARWDFPRDEIEARATTWPSWPKVARGVALLSRTKPDEVIYGFDSEADRDEARLIRAHVAGIHVINSYVPQGRSIDDPVFQYKLAWYGRLRALLEQHYRSDDLLAWVGDLNVAPGERDLYDPKGNRDHVDFHPDVREAYAQARAGAGGCL